MQLPEGVTYRRLHYWTKMGYLPDEGLTPGTGHPRKWTPARLRMLRLMGKLRLAGIEAPQAGMIATEMGAQVTGDLVVEISPGVTVRVDLDALLFPETPQTQEG